MRLTWIAAVAGSLLVFPAVAGAAPEGELTQTDTEFLAAVGQWGFSGGWQRTVAAGQALCGLLDQGATESATDSFVISTFGQDMPSREQSYRASMFTLYAAQYYCPKHFARVSF